MGEEGLRRYASLRLEVGNSLVAFEVVILRPFCWSCQRSMYGVEPDDPELKPNIIPVLPSSSEDILCLFDKANHCVTFIIDEENQPPYEIGCWMCGRQQEVHDGATIPVDIEAFSDYFHREEGVRHKNPSPSFKRRLKALYGNTCVNCRNGFQEEDLTVDHIVARVHGGDASPLNLQVLCRACNEEKADSSVQTLRLYLDFDLQPIQQ